MLLLLTFLLSLNSFGQPEADPVVSSYNFTKGEQLDFRLSYGWFTVGKASVNISSDYHEYETKDCFKVDVAGTTAGLVGIFTNVNDSWGAYITKKELSPLHSYRDIQEGKYVRKERTYFDHQNQKVEVLRYDPRKEDASKPRKVYDTPQGVKDLMSAYLYLRNVDFSKYALGDTIIIDTFYEDELYNFKLLLDKREKLESKVGDIMAYKMYLLLPTSDLFPEEKGIVAWVSADANHLPLRIEAEMFFGRAYCELTGYRNIKYGPDYQTP